MRQKRPDRRGGEIRAAGGIVRRTTPSGIELVIVHRPTYRDWALPKGRLTAGETPEAAALREVMEEAACRATIVRSLGASEYQFRGRRKTVMFYLMDAEEEFPFTPNPEIDALLWVSPQEALRRLDYAQERALVKEAFSLT